MDEGPLKSYPPLAPMDESSLDVNTSYAQILHFVEGSPKVVDFGCGPGNLARFLAQRGCAVFGVEINPDSAGLAREYCADVLIADLETASPLKLFPTERFDVAIFADILEHLRKPERLLAETMRILRPGGYVIASIPNVAHGAVRLAMLKGEFNYQDIGVLDEAHLRFFTRKTMETLFENAGFFIDEIAHTTAPIFEASGVMVPTINRADFSDEITAKIMEEPESNTLQFIVKAVPAASSEARQAENQRKTAALTLRVRELEEKLQAAEAELSEKLDAPTREHFEEVQNQLHLTLLGPDGVESLRTQLGEVQNRLHLALLGPDGIESLRTQLQQKSDEVDTLRDQLTAASAREESTSRRETKIAEENLQAAESIAQLKTEIAEREATIGTLRAELDVAAQTIRQGSAELAKLGNEMSAVTTREESANRRQSELSEENLQAAESIAHLKQEVDEREAMIGTLRAELDVAAQTIREGSAELAKLGNEMSAVTTREESANRRQSQLAEENLQAAESIAHLKQEVDERKATIRGLRTQLESVAKDLREKSKESVANRKEIGALQGEIALERQRIARLESELESGEQDLAGALSTIDGQQKVIATLKIEHEAARDDVAHAQTQARNLDTLYKTAESERHHLSVEIDELRGEYVKTRRSSLALGQEIEKLRAELEGRERVQQTVERAKADLEALYKSTESHRLQLSDEIDELRAEHEKVRRSGLASIEEIERLNAELDERERVQNAMVRARGDLEALYKSTEAHRLQLSDEFDELRGEYLKVRRSNLASAQEVVKLRAELGDHKRVRNTMEQAARNAKKQYAEVLTELNQARAATVELTSRCARDEFYLEEMRKSKFWRLRNGWFSVKRAFGITTEIP